MQRMFEGNEEQQDDGLDNLREYIIKQTKQDNDRIGSLNQKDGISCNKCHNKGIIFYPSEDGLSVECQECSCMQQRRNIRNIKNSGMGDLLNYRIGNYVATEEWQKNVKEIALDYVKNNKDNWFTFVGKSGIGKTMICSAIANNYVRNLGVETKYVIWNDFIDDVKDFESDTFQEIKSVPVLYIDDLLKGKATEWQREVFFKLINYRYNNKLVTIISSELSFEQLKDFDEAVASRIYQMSGKYFLQVFKAENYRTKGK